MIAATLVDPARGADPAAAHALLDEAGTWVARGRVRRALEVLLRIERDHGRLLDHPARATLLGLLLDCRLAQGDVREAEALGDELASLGDHLAAHHALAELASALGEHELAVDRYLAAAAAAHDDLGPWHAGAALAMARAGRHADAHDLACRHHADAVDRGSASDVARALRVLATTDPEPRRVALLRRALELLDGVEADRLRAQLETDLAGLLLLDGNRADAVTLLRDAERYAGREGLLPLRGRIRRLLERMGETPRRLEAETLAALTAGERRVARLALDGRSNRQIAELLEVSVKAVEGHLSKVYRKLGVASRSALAAATGGATSV